MHFFSINDFSFVLTSIAYSAQCTRGAVHSSVHCASQIYTNSIVLNCTKLFLQLPALKGKQRIADPVICLMLIPGDGAEKPAPPAGPVLACKPVNTLKPQNLKLHILHSRQETTPAACPPMFAFWPPAAVACCLLASFIAFQTEMKTLLKPGSDV